MSTFLVFFRYTVILFLGFCFAPLTSTAADSLPMTMQIEYAVSGDDGIIAVRITPHSGYYAYAHRSDADIPTTLIMPASAHVWYPEGTLRQDSLDPEKTVLAYDQPFDLFIRAPRSALKGISGQLSLLLCSKKNCIPVRQTISFDIPADAPPLEKQLWAAAYREHTSTSIPTQSSTVQVQAASNPTPVALIPPSQDEWRFVPRFFQEALEPAAIWTALLFGIGAGLLLNVMPCVLPVLTMKIASLLAASGEKDDARRIRHFREHNLLFAAGILTWFAVLAVSVGGLGLAWGSLFQSAGVVYGLLILIFLLALSLFDVFTLPVLDFKFKPSANPRMQAYLTGLVATLLATPCSGPLLGGVLGWAALQPFHVVLIVFLATGTGMALPYLALAAKPGMAAILPKPGPWTGVMERLVGFFLMGTAIYLLSILPEYRRIGTLAVVLVVALAAWIWGQWGGLRASLQQKVVVGIVCLAMSGGAIVYSLQPQPQAVAWQAFSESSFREQLGKDVLFVVFTADWCPSCKVLERTTLKPERLHALARQYKLQLIKVDLTRPDPQAEALLRSLGSVSIPVTAIFPRGLLAKSPLVLRDLYTPSQLEVALERLR